MLDSIVSLINHMYLEHELSLVILLTVLFILFLVIVVRVFNSVTKYHISKHVLHDSTKNFNETVEYDAQFDKSRNYNYVNKSS